MNFELLMQNRLQTLIESDQKLNVAYLMPEFPMTDATLPVLFALQNSGVNLIELGIPFSDPLADGSVIQRAALKSIENGVTLKKLLALVKVARESENYAIHIPIVLMGYYNPMYSYGVESFIADAVKHGVDGFIIPDLPPEEASLFRTLAASHGLSVTFLISPVTIDARIQEIDSLSTHFSYCVSVNATTGTSKLAGGIEANSLKDYLSRVRKNTKKKFVVGFGIKTPEQVHEIQKNADGVVVGSALLNAIQSATSPENAAHHAQEFCHWLFLNSN